MKLPTIYKRTSTGKVQEWTIEIDNDKYRTISGQRGGKSVTSEWTVCKGKNLGKANATSPAEQALKEAEAKRRLKLESEYRESVEDVDDLEFREPLLAKDYKEHTDKVVFPVWSQPKLDGVRCIVTKDGMFSRNGKPLPGAPHIFESLKPLFEENPNLELDGELYNHVLKADFDKLISLVRKQKPDQERLADSKRLVQYHIYDIRDPEAGFADRLRRLQKLIADNITTFEYCLLVETFLCNDQEELDEAYASWIEEGYEGQMIRIAGKGYEFKRSVNLLKRKEFIDQEFEILDIEEGTGNRSGMAGFMRFEIDGKPFKSNMRGGEEYYKELLTNKKNYIGKSATVRYQNLTPDGIPRFPVVTKVAREDYE